METKHDKHGGNAFFWGLIIGALFATLLTTKRGRQILRELTNLGLELFEDFVEEKTTKSSGPKVNQPPDEDIENIEEVKQDLESEITEIESKPEESIEEPLPPKEPKPNGNGHSVKRRLFRGIRRK